MKSLLAVSLIAAAVLTGCAANVQRASTDTAPLRMPVDSSKNIVMNVTGSSIATESDDWEPFKGEWRSAMATAAAARGARFSAQDGPSHPTGEPGTLVVVDVKDYRYLTSGAHFGFGIMTGNAYIDANVRLLDLETGAPLGARAYKTSSTAWQGVFSAMTGKQVRAICDEVITEIAPP